MRTPRNDGLDDTPNRHLRRLPGDRVSEPPLPTRQHLAVDKGVDDGGAQRGGGDFAALAADPGGRVVAQLEGGDGAGLEGAVCCFEEDFLRGGGGIPRFVGGAGFTSGAFCVVVFGAGGGAGGGRDA